jgi:hypothetical protein
MQVPVVGFADGEAGGCHAELDTPEAGGNAPRVKLTSAGTLPPGVTKSKFFPIFVQSGQGC